MNSPNNTPDTICSFRGDYAFLSNFYPCQIRYHGLVYPSVENAYQASKTNVLRQRIPFVGIAPGDAKKLGKKVQLRENWVDVRVNIMHTLLRIKFVSNPKLRQMLLDTNSALLVEGNWWGDRFWGVCNGQGENVLGKLLMQVRDSLKG